MSKVETRFPLSVARAWAGQVAGTCGLYSPMVMVAGSIRRKRPDVGDIDIVLVDDASNPWMRQQLAGELALLDYVQTKDGERIASFTREGSCGIDLYFATPETWGVTLLVRTGSAAHNIKLTQVGAKMAPARKLSVARGILDTAGNVVASRTEEEIFAALGMAYVAPEEREAPEFEYMVRSED